MSESLQRIQLLIAQHRNDLAERELRGVLAQSPSDATAHALLAICISDDDARYAEATTECEQAIGLEPDEAFHHYAYATIWLKRQHFDRASSAIEEAIRLEPEDADYHAIRSQCRLLTQDYKGALEAANQSLACDPENLAARNFRVISLERLGMGEESVFAAREAVSRDPDDSMSHATHGFALLNSGNHREAPVAFRESLRLDPNNEMARSGMISAMNSRSFIFRLIYKFFVFMGRLNSKAAFGLIFGAWVLVQILSRAAQQMPALQLIVLPLIFFYCGFVLITWIAMPLFNTFLRFHPFGRHLLDRNEYWASNFIAASLATALYCFIAWVWFGDFANGMIMGIYWILMSIPIAAAFRMPTQKQRICFAVATVVVGLLPFWAAYQSIDPPDPATFSTGFRTFGFGILGIQILSNVIAARTVKF